MADKTEAPTTTLFNWGVALWPRNTDERFNSFTIEVQATSKQEAINKALSQHPGHAWGRVMQLEAEPPHVLVQEGKPVKAAHEASVIHERAIVPAEALTPEQEKGLWAESWEPTRREGEELSIAQIVQEAIGSASMCWKQTPQGIFDSERASWVAGGAIDAIERVVFWQTGFHPGGKSMTLEEAEQKVLGKRRTAKSGIDPNELVKEQNTDGQLWAIAFAEQFDLPEELDGHILGWFANAIETGKNHVRNAPRPQNVFGADLPPFESFGEGDDQADAHENDVLTKSDPREIGMAEEPEECRQARIRRDADKAAVIELILSYRNPADEETRMRQIRVVMD